jgi:hypothetical protein
MRIILAKTLLLLLAGAFLWSDDCMAQTTCFSDVGVEIPGCECHPNCATCGYNGAPTNPDDCISCADGTSAVIEIYPDGTGACGICDGTELFSLFKDSILNAAQRGDGDFPPECAPQFAAVFECASCSGNNCPSECLDLDGDGGEEDDDPTTCDSFNQEADELLTCCNGNCESEITAFRECYETINECGDEGNDPTAAPGPEPTTPPASSEDDSAVGPAMGMMFTASLLSGATSFLVIASLL